MAKICLIALIGFGVALVAQCAAAKDLREDYLLDLPNPSEFDEPLHENVRKAISEMDIDGTSKPEEIREQIDEMNDKGHTGVSRALQNLDFVPLPNNLELIDTLKSTLAQLDAAKPKDKVFASNARVLLDKYIRPKFRAMDFWYKHAFNTTTVKEVLNAMDGTFSNLLNVDTPEPCHQDELEEWLEDLELDEAELDVPKMLKVLRGDRKTPICEATIGPFQWVMNTNCEKMHSFSNLIEMLELDGAIRDLDELPAGRPKRINDYYKICQDWQNLDKRQLIEKNFQKQLDASRPECSVKRPQKAPTPTPSNDEQDHWQ